MLTRKFTLGVAVLSLLVGSLGFSPSALASKDSPMPNGQQLRAAAEKIDKQLVPVYLAGPQTRGKRLMLGKKEVGLPDDAYVDKYIVTMSCIASEDCESQLPVLVLARGNSKVWVSGRTGKILKEEYAPGENGLFDWMAPGDMVGGAVYAATYAGERPEYQFAAAGVENWAFWDLVLGNKVKWWAANSTVAGYMRTAVSGWQAATGGIQYFQEVTSASSAVLTVVNTGCEGCWGRLEVDMLWHDPIRNANYLGKATLNLNTAIGTPVGGWSATTAHELGHVLGLGEQYTKTSIDPDCSPNSTIMNSGSCSNRPSAPTSADGSRVNAFWTTGDLSAVTSSASGSMYTIRWTDQSWSEHYVILSFERYNSSTAKWESVTPLEIHVENIGLRSTDTWNTLQIERTLDRTTYNSPPGTYRACVQTQHWAAGDRKGTLRCAPSKVLN